MMRKIQVTHEAQPEVQDRFEAFAMNDFGLPAARPIPARRAYLAQCFGRVARAAGRVLHAPAAGSMRVEADVTRRLPARRVMGGPALRDLAELRGLITRLQRSERDLRARLAKREAELDTPPGAPHSDPLYQRLFFALARLRDQLANAHEDFSRNASEGQAPPRGPVG